MSANQQRLKIGVLGGGQLGKMLYRPAIQLDLQLFFMDPDPEAPCSKISPHFTQGRLTDFNEVMNFGADKDLITIEIENVNTDALQELEKQGKMVFPQPHIIKLIQDKRLQKQYYRDHGFPTAPFHLIDQPTDAQRYLEFFPAFTKLAKEGYDGKGVRKINGMEDFHLLFDAPGLLEKAVEIEKEISVLVSRNQQGDCITYPVVELVFDPRYHLVDYLLAPADISKELAEQAEQLAIKLAQSLGIVGILAVEMFISTSGELLINEIAPRTHNSGHHSIEACYTSQFEQQLRSITNMPLGSTRQIKKAAMVNLIGADGYFGRVLYEGIDSLLKLEGVYVHLYGKTETRPGRKMGHVTILADDHSELVEKAKAVKNKIKVVS